MPAKDFKIKVKKGGYPVVLPIDGYAIDATVTRFTVQQLAEFALVFQRVEDPHSARLVAMRMPGEEQQKRSVSRELTAAEREVGAKLEELRTRRAALEGTGAALELLDVAIATLATLLAIPPEREEFVIDADEIRRRRLVEMSADQRAEYERLHDAEERYAAAAIAEVLAEHLTIAPGQIVETDPGTGEDYEITSGADFARIYGGRREVLHEALQVIHYENTLPEPLKNALSSRRGSPRSSDARELDASAGDHGERPEAPVPSAEPEPSATSGTVTASSAETSSGAMAEAIA